MVSLVLLASVCAEDVVCPVEVAPVLAADRTMVALSAVKGKISQTRFLWIENTGSERVETPTVISGEDAGAFEVIDAPEYLGAGTKGRWTLAFQPKRGNARHRALMTVGTGGPAIEVTLTGLGQVAFEADNEPALKDIVEAFGMGLDVGGDGLEMSTDEETIGDSVAACYFRVAGPEPVVTVRALARYSPQGEVPFGLFREGSGELEEIGRLAKSNGLFHDAHQTLYPPLKGELDELEFEPGDGPFGLYLKGHFYTSFTDPARESKGKKVKHTARIYPVKRMLGNELKNAWLVG
ncbi:MAG: hypothetical protein ACQCXQ_02745, partial [Verrucomicrobiales bacterium]